MNQEGGGWTTFLRRTDGSVDFSIYGYDKITGGTTGLVDHEFNMSLSLLNAITTGTRNELDVSMNYNGINYNAKYGLFQVGDAASKFALTIGEYSAYSTAGDSLTGKSNGMAWSTYDSDNDLSTSNCATTHSSAFWFGDCTDANPLGTYGDTNPGKGVNWNSLFGDSVSLDFIEFKFRPNTCAFGPSKTCSDCGPGKYICSI